MVIRGKQIVIKSLHFAFNKFFFPFPFIINFWFFLQKNKQIILKTLISNFLLTKKIKKFSFEKNYIAYLQNKIAIKVLINSIPTRTPAQTQSHLNKKKYELDRKFCAIGNKSVRAEIFSINEFFEKEKFQKTPKPTQLVYLHDEMKKKNYAISLENFVLLKKFFPSGNELNLNFQAVHNFLLAVKAEREYSEMLKRHDSEMKR